MTTKELMQLFNTRPHPVTTRICIPELLVDIEVECVIRQTRVHTQGVDKAGLVLFIPENLV